MTTTNIQTIEDDRGFWVRIDVDGGELTLRGPFSDPDEAEATACRIAAISRALHAEVHFPPAGARKR